MQIPILNGIYADSVADYRTSYPINLIPVPKQTGVSEGYLRTAPGIESFSTGQGIDRGGINWNNVMYRVSGSNLIKVDSSGVVTVLGTIEGTLDVAMIYSFDDLGICSDGIAYLYNETDGLRKITDTDLGSVFDVVWIDGYWIYTDGEFLIQSELSDPSSFVTTKYGSSESDPDPITGVMKLRNELYALNRYTIEVFQNVGGNNFAFQRINGALVNVGCVGYRAKDYIADGIAVIGSPKNSPLGVYYVEGANSAKISTREIDQIIATYTEEELAQSANVANVILDSHDFLFVYLPRHTMVWDKAASEAAQQPVWFFLTSDIDFETPYRGTNPTYCYNKWIFGDTQGSNIGNWTFKKNTQYGNTIGWRFDTQFLYGESRGFIMHSMELVGLPGKSVLGTDPVIFSSYTKDGVTWSDEKLVSTGKTGEYNKRMVWRRLGASRLYRGIRFRGADTNIIAFARLEAEIEALNG